MKEELKLLVALQEIDSVILRKRLELKKAPEEIKRYQGPLSESEKAYRREKEKCEAIEKKKKQKELEVKEVDDRIEKLKSRMSDIKTNKEYQARLKEIEAIERERSRLEDDILYMMEELDEVSGGLKEAESRIGDEKKRLQSLQKELDEKSDLIKKELAELEEQREALARKIPAALYNRYMDVFQKSSGLSVVEAEDERCLGCYMSIPPQIYVEIKMSEEIVQCPQCGRFLYRKETAAGEPEEQGSKNSG
ncbi:hypothetical protein MNBD_NITROSPIRAE02-1391 [hydrothermal vent metagenome]|uniref:Uncharacterized protein n=1 Tax=hydrothermal vent metagenome TaxID=652676 RepID=A0A3B1CBS9_9ZZZZ